MKGKSTILSLMPCLSVKERIWAYIRFSAHSYCWPPNKQCQMDFISLFWMFHGSCWEACWPLGCLVSTIWFHTFWFRWMNFCFEYVYNISTGLCYLPLLLSSLGGSAQTSCISINILTCYTIVCIWWRQNEVWSPSATCTQAFTIYLLNRFKSVLSFHFCPLSNTCGLLYACLKLCMQCKCNTVTHVKAMFKWKLDF